MCAIAMLAPGLKFDTQKIHLLWTDHSAEQPAFEGRSDRACGAARGVCTKNLNPDVMVMKSAKDRA